MPEYRLIRHAATRDTPPTLSLHQIFFYNSSGEPVFHHTPDVLCAQDLQGLCDIVSGFVHALRHGVIDFETVTWADNA